MKLKLEFDQNSENNYLKARQFILQGKHTKDQMITIIFKKLCEKQLAKNKNDTDRR